MIFDEARRSKLTSPKSQSKAILDVVKEDLEKKIQEWQDSQLEPGKRIKNERHIA